MTITIQLSGTAQAALNGLQVRIQDLPVIHAVMAGAAERFVKDFGARTSQGEHRSATRLGGRQTNHLSRAYQAIESSSDAGAASLFVPRASRLRAAFGAYTVTPGPGKTYLTIPVSGEAYGKRAGEMQGLVAMRVGPKKTPILARPDGEGRITTHFLLAKKADIPADPSLIPFDAMAADAADAAELHILKGGNAS